MRRQLAPRRAPGRPPAPPEDGRCTRDPVKDRTAHNPKVMRSTASLRSTAPPQRLQGVTNGLHARGRNGLATQASSSALPPDNRRAVPHSQDRDRAIAPQDRSSAHEHTRPESHAHPEHTPPSDRGSPTSRLRPEGSPCALSPTRRDHPTQRTRTTRRPLGTRSGRPDTHDTHTRRRSTHTRPEDQATVHKAPTPDRTRKHPPEHDRGPASHPTSTRVTTATGQETRPPTAAPTPTQAHVIRDVRTTHPTANPSRSRTQHQAFPIAMPLTSSAPKDTPGGGQHRQT